ncbi:MAG: asparagine synthase (glutamine-hydrolyzing) [Phycisphaerales bacterium]
MCGIAGILALDRGAAAAALGRMVCAQTHRGPDDEGSEIAEVGGVHAGLGQRRLAIIDLSPTGHQPMTHAGTGDLLTYNGEVYNFPDLRRELEGLGETFRGRSDSEVVLHALARWGEAALERLCGMYALAFVDRRNGRLLLARDPLGIKPLYIAEVGQPGERGHAVLFASEVRAIIASGLVRPEVDPAAAAGMLAFGAVQEPLTIFKGIRAVPPGAAVAIDLAGGKIGRARTVAQWRFPATRPEMDEGAAAAEVERTLETSVREHLVSDRPVGVFLSSGIDSTIVASLAARHTERLRTFTVGFADEPDLSEAPLTRQTAADLGVEHTEVQVTGAEALDATRAWLSALDQPSMDGLNVYVISRAVRRHGIIVALSGQGGDELFAGYSVFTDVLKAARAMRPLAWLPRHMRGGLASLATARRPAAVRFKAADMARSKGGLRELYFHRRRLMSDAQLAGLGLTPGGGAGGLGLDASFMPREALEEDLAIRGDPIATLSRLESRYYLGNTLLRDGDANGMAHGLEIRVPFLDRRMLAAAYAIPGRTLMPHGSADKHILRRAFGRYLRPELANQKKRGFVLPMRRWMQGPLRDQCDAALANLKRSGLVESGGVDAVWRDFQHDPESPIWTRALAMVVLGQYLHDRT